MTQDRDSWDMAGQEHPKYHARKPLHDKNHFDDQHRQRQPSQPHEKGGNRDHEGAKSDKGRSKPLTPANNEAQSLGFAQAATSPGPPSSVHPFTTQGDAMQAPAPLATQKEELSSVSSTPESPKVNVAVVAGATVGAIVLLLFLVTAIVYRRCCYKKQAAKTTESVHGEGTEQIRDGHRTIVRSTGSREPESARRATSSMQNQNLQQSSEREHIKLPLPLDGILAQLTAEAISDQSTRSFSQTHDNTTSADDSRRGVGSQLTGRHPDEQQGSKILDFSHRISFKPDEKGCDSEEWQIDRCLSYYLKRHTRSSLHPGTLQEMPSPPLPQPFVAERSPTSTKVQDRFSRKSLKLPKTTNLLEKIRRLQSHRDGDALPQSNKEDGCFLNSYSYAPRASFEGQHGFTCSICSPSSKSSEYDASSSYVSSAPQTPVEQAVPISRNSYPREHRQDVVNAANELDTLGSSPAVSEPHSAFEYADYYDSYLPGPHASVRLQLTNEDGEDGLSLPWQNHSPCKTSALSPRHSTSFSLRQRSGTLSLASPLPPPLSTKTDAVSSEGGVAQQAKCHLSQGPGTHRPSSEMDEVIRF